MSSLHGPMLFLALGVMLSLMLLILSIGMGATVTQLFSLFRRPLQLLKLVVAVNVVVPVAGAIMIALLPLSPVVRMGIMVMAVSPGPPMLGFRAVKVDPARALGVYAAVVLLSFVIVPLTVAILSNAYGLTDRLKPLAVTTKMGVLVVLPMLLGIGLHRMAPALALRLSPIVNWCALGLLAIVALPLAVLVWPAMWDLVGNGTILAMALVVVIALAAGHMLGGPDPAERGVLALAAGVRNPGIALAVATGLGSDKGVGAAVLTFLLVGAIVSLPYQVWIVRRTRPQAPQVVGTEPRPGASVR